MNSSQGVMTIIDDPLLEKFAIGTTTRILKTGMTVTEEIVATQRVWRPFDPDASKNVTESRSKRAAWQARDGVANAEPAKHVFWVTDGQKVFKCCWTMRGS